AISQKSPDYPEIDIHIQKLLDHDYASLGYKSNCQYKDKSNATDHLLAASELASR
ncbi:hypothetical protein JMJ77_0013621, partial [Colletotrichum scovillei]